MAIYFVAAALCSTTQYASARSSLSLLSNSGSESLSVSELFKSVSTSLVYNRFLLAMIDYARLQTIYRTPALSQVETDSVSECAIKVSLV